MGKKPSRLGSAIFGLLLAAVFLVLTFRDIDLAELLGQLSRVGIGDTLILMGLSWLSFLLRGVRWWFLLPRPLESGEFWRTTRAMMLGYGVNNVASRIGEVVRVVVLKRDTGRDYGSLTSTVVVDRILFDFLAFAALTAFAIYSFRDHLVAMFPTLETAFQIFVLVTVGAILGMTLLAFKPAWFQRLVVSLRLDRLPIVGHRLTDLIDQLSEGLTVLGRPRDLVFLIGVNINVWMLSIVYFWYSLAVFQIDATPAMVVVLFTISSFGIIMPSPGGLGTVHYFLTVALVQFLAVEDSQAAVVATYSHGVNYLGITIAAVICLLLRPGKRRGRGEASAGSRAIPE